MHAPPTRPSGRLTLPSQLLTDRHFVYTPSMHTDVARTIARARERSNRCKADLGARIRLQAGCRDLINRRNDC